MAGRIREELVDEVKAATDIVELIASYVPLKRSGKSYKARCPFHEEKTPSFMVNPDRQSYRCFGCGEGGSVFTFVMAFERIGFPEAVRVLADRAGISIETTVTSPGDGADRSRILEALRFAGAFYHRQLGSAPGADALRYLRGRGITDESIREFELGYAPNGWTGLLEAARRAQFAPSVLEAAGLVLPGKSGSHYDRFRNRVIFTIRDTQERIVGFGARTLGDEEPKYLNSPETPVFNKSKTLYGLDRAKEAVRDEREISVGEGYTDVILAHQHGIRKMVATLGTSLTKDHARLLRRFADRITLVFDADPAGQRASKRGVETLLEADFDVRVAELPDGVDPCDFVVSRGADAFRATLDGARDFFDFCLDAARRAEGDITVRSKARMGEKLIEIVRQVGSPIKRGLLIRRLSEELEIPEQHLMEALQKKGRGLSRPIESSPSETTDLRPLSAPERAERDLLEALAHRSGVLADVKSRFGTELFRREDHRSLATLLFERFTEGDGIDLEAVLGEVEDPGVARLVTEFLKRERSNEEYDSLADGALRFFEKSQRKSDLRALAAERKEAMEKGDDQHVNDVLKRTFKAIQEGDLARKD